MRIGLYGMPTAGKTYIMDQIDFMEVIVGSKLLRQYDPDFDKRDETGREKDRKDVANIMLSKPEFIMDGHYAFGDEIAFTEEEGNMYEIYIYLYVDPEVLRSRMNASQKNQKYLKFDIKAWQQREIDGLREYCHKHNKDFYVIDNPPENAVNDASDIIQFIKDIRAGYSCVDFAKKCVKAILEKSSSDEITLYDGDKTLTVEDTSGKVFGYKTHLYDGNFYTGYQAWKQSKDFENYVVPEIHEIPVRMNEAVLSTVNADSYILTSGHETIWKFIASQYDLGYFCGEQMSAETKYYVTKLLQEAGKRVIAYGDGMNDYYMLKQADVGYLILKPDGTVSKSLRGKDLEGLRRIKNV